MTRWKTIEPSNTLNIRKITHRRRSSLSCLYGEFHCFSTVQTALVTISRYDIVTMCYLDKTAGLVGAGSHRALAILLGRHEKWFLAKVDFDRQGKIVRP